MTFQNAWILSPLMATMGEKIRKAREMAGLTQTALGKAVGVTRNAVSLWESDTNGPTTETLLKVCSTLRISPETMMPIMGNAPAAGQMPVRGEVRAGAWLEIDDERPDAGTIPALPDPRYSRVQRFALRVVGTSMNRVAPPGQYVIVADWASMGMELRDGDLVVVRRERAMTYEVTLKRAKMGEKGWELWPESTDPKYQEPVILDDGGRDVVITVIGKVVGRYEPL